MRNILMFFCLCMAGFCASAQTQNPIQFHGNHLLVGEYAGLFIDSSNSLSYLDVKKKAEFSQPKLTTYNFGLSNVNYWFRFTIQNHSSENNLALEIEYSMLDSTELFYEHDGKIYRQSVLAREPFNNRLLNHKNPTFLLQLPKDSTWTYYVKVNGDELVIIPFNLRSENTFWKSALINEIISGLHFGLLLVMILYNLFIFFTIWDKSYLYYVLYILFICLSQATITGYTFKYLWPNSPYFANLSIILFAALGGIFAIAFFRHFLHTSTNAPLIHKWLNVVGLLYIAAIIVRIAGQDRLSFRMIDISNLFATSMGLFVSARLSLKGYRPAKFFFFAWVIFLVGIILYVLRNLNLLPYNILSNYTLQIGTAVEVVMLSFALADKIKILRQEEAASRERAIVALRENERIVREQNIILEGKVQERTQELTETNAELSQTLTQLKDAQTQLVESEKLASLGQLTAGIAHEINNPINFVSANIKPLKRDIDDILQLLTEYDDISNAPDIAIVKEKIKSIERLKTEIDLDYLKEELDLLLKGIEEGAHRTVEIVKGLKNFSHLDENDVDTVNINEGIQSTLILLNNQIGDRIKVTSNLGKIPEVECYPGKLNQVFMNILTNAIFAVTDKPVSNGTKPSIWITTMKEDEQHIKIAIKDNGMGMTSEVKARIFDPFFTTKDVGKGTGLGLSIVFKIIEAHNGTIDVVTEPNKGTEFIITLPLSQN